MWRLWILREEMLIRVLRHNYDLKHIPDLCLCTPYNLRLMHPHLREITNAIENKGIHTSWFPYYFLKVNNLRYDSTCQLMAKNSRLKGLTILLSMNGDELSWTDHIRWVSFSRISVVMWFLVSCRSTRFLHGKHLPHIDPRYSQRRARLPCGWWRRMIDGCSINQTTLTLLQLHCGEGYKSLGTTNTLKAAETCS